MICLANRDILYALAERRQAYWKHMQPVEEILAKLAIRDERRQILIRGGNDAHIHFDVMLSPDPLKFSFLQYPKQFDLHRRRDLADLI